MVDVVPSKRPFARHLAWWSVRGVLCAWMGFSQALQHGYSGRIEIAAMSAGVASVILLCAWGTALPFYAAVQGNDFGRALRIAANLRASVAVLALVGTFLSVRELVAPAFALDLWTGMLAVTLVRSTGGPEQLNAGNGESFGWTYFTTLVHGCLVVVMIVVLAVAIRWVVTGWRRTDE